MKLIFCPKCQDVVKFSMKVKRYCRCGASWGYYTDDINAVCGGDTIPIALHNTQLGEAIRRRPKRGLGSRFEAWVIPVHCKSVKQGGADERLPSIFDQQSA